MSQISWVISILERIHGFGRVNRMSRYKFWREPMRSNSSASLAIIQCMYLLCLSMSSPVPSFRKASLYAVIVLYACFMVADQTLYQ